jgi:hypothetical protein
MWKIETSQTLIWVSKQHESRTERKAERPRIPGGHNGLLVNRYSLDIPFSAIYEQNSFIPSYDSSGSGTRSTQPREDK